MRRHMTSRGWLTGGLPAGLLWMWLGLGLSEAGPVPPSDPGTLKLLDTSSVTISLYQLDSTLPTTVNLQSPSRCISSGTQGYRDVTDCWLPELGKPVYVVVHGSTIAPTLVAPTAVAVSFPLAA